MNVKYEIVKIKKGNCGKFLRTVCGVTRNDHVRNKAVCEKRGISKNVVICLESTVFVWTCVSIVVREICEKEYVENGQ